MPTAEAPTARATSVSKATQNTMPMTAALRRVLSTMLAGCVLAVAADAPASAQTPEADQPRGTSIPDNARGPGIGAKGYRLESLGDGLYTITEGSYNTMFLVTRTGVVAVDAPPTMASVIPKAIREVTRKPVTHVIYSHSHADHIGAADIYPRKATRIAHRDTASQLRRFRDPKRRVPDVTFSRGLRLRVGGKTLELSYKGLNHEPGNIFVWAPRQRVLMLVDVVFPGWVPFRNLSGAEDIPGYFKAIEQVLDYPFRRLVAGHLTRLGTRADVRNNRAYLRDVRAAAQQALTDVSFAEVIEAFPSENQWTIFDTYLDRVTRRCTDLVAPAWRDRLGGVDAFTFDHCWTVAQSLRLGDNLRDR